MASITIVGGGHDSIVHPLHGRDRLTVGSGADNDLRLPHDALVAFEHAEIRAESDQWILIRRTLQHGLQLNGHAVGAPTPLRSGDEIVVGSTRLRFDAFAARRSAGRSKPVDRPADAEDSRWLPSGASVNIQTFNATLRRLAASDSTLLLFGETGSGKEVSARALHALSPRRDAPFMVVNCPALPSSLVEPELFGIERGVATGVEARKGLLESANHGTVFFDEIGDLDLQAQTKLLRFLEERTIDSVGGRKKIRLDVRILAATHHDLEADVAARLFRLDLYHRLKVLTLHVPPLRERSEDLALLIGEFVRRDNGSAWTVSPEALRILQSYRWPGNVRELKHLVERLETVVDGAVVLPEHLPSEIHPRPGTERTGSLYRYVIEDRGCFWELVQQPFLRRELARDEVRGFIERAYRDAGSSYLRLAQLMRIGHHHKRLLDFLRRHDLGVRKPSIGRVVRRGALG